MKVYNLDGQSQRIPDGKGGWKSHREDTAPTSRYGKVKALQADAKLFNFLMKNGISSMEQLYEKVSAINSDYYDLRGKIVKTERWLTVLNERLEMWAMREWTFSNDNGKCPQMKHACFYVENWPTMQEENIGYLL